MCIIHTSNRDMSVTDHLAMYHCYFHLQVAALHNRINKLAIRSTGYLRPIPQEVVAAIH